MLGREIEEKFKNGGDMFQNLIGMLGRNKGLQREFCNSLVSKPYRYARKPIKTKINQDQDQCFKTL